MFAPVKVTRMTVDKPGYRTKHFRAIAKSYCYGQEKYKYENFDSYGSTRVVVHRGNSLDVWDYYTKDAVFHHRNNVQLNTAVAIGILGLCIVDAVFNS